MRQTRRNGYALRREAVLKLRIAASMSRPGEGVFGRCFLSLTHSADIC
jgi:hypothetical protein